MSVCSAYEWRDLDCEKANKKRVSLAYEHFLHQIRYIWDDFTSSNKWKYSYEISLKSYYIINTNSFVLDVRASLTMSKMKLESLANELFILRQPWPVSSLLNGLIRWRKFGFQFHTERGPFNVWIDQYRLIYRRQPTLLQHKLQMKASTRDAAKSRLSWLGQCMLIYSDSKRIPFPYGIGNRIHVIWWVL
jgi:hypothetical protein